MSSSTNDRMREARANQRLRGFLYFGMTVVMLGAIITTVYLVHYFVSVVPNRRSDTFNRFQEIVCSNPGSYAPSIVSEYDCSKFVPSNPDQDPQTTPTHPSLRKSPQATPTTTTGTNSFQTPQPTATHTTSVVIRSRQKATGMSKHPHPASVPTKKAVRRSPVHSAPSPTVTKTKTAPTKPQPQPSTTCVLQTNVLGLRVCLPL